MHRAIDVRLAATRRQRRAFLLFPWSIYRGDPNWVPPIVSDRAARFDPNENSLFQNGEVEPFVALQKGRVVGTIAMAVDHRANRLSGRRVANFGFLECVDDYVVAQALFDRAVAWARARGLTMLRGPQNFSVNDEPGLLIEGRNTPAMILMGWTPPYYVDFVERYGFRKWRDSLAYRVYREDLLAHEGDVLPPKFVRVAEHTRRRYDYAIRCADPADWDAEMETARCIYNNSLGVLPEFTPMGEQEWRQQAQKMRKLIDPDLALFAQVDGQAVGFGLALPDINQALWHCNGLRYPWNYLQLWRHSRRIHGLSFKIMAMQPEYWGRGLDALIYLEIARQAVRKGYHWIDMSLTGEDNPRTNKLATRVGAMVDKRYRSYELDVDV